MAETSTQMHSDHISAMLCYCHHGAILHGDVRPFSFAFETEHGKYGQEPCVENNEFGLLLARDVFVNTAKYNPNNNEVLYCLFYRCQVFSHAVLVL